MNLVEARRKVMRLEKELADARAEAFALERRGAVQRADDRGLWLRNQISIASEGATRIEMVVVREIGA